MITLSKLIALGVKHVFLFSKEATAIILTRDKIQVSSNIIKLKYKQ